MSLENALNENTAAIKELAKIMAGIKALPADTSAAVTEAVQEAKPDTKKEATKAEEPVETEETTKAETSAPETSEKASKPTTFPDYKKEVVPAVTEVAKKLGREGALKVLAQFGVQSAQELEAANWQALIDACKKAIEE